MITVNTLRRSTPVLILGVLLMAGPSGCAISRRPLPLTPSQTEQLKARLGSIGVVAACFVPKAELKTPAKGKVAGAGQGAVSGAGTMLEITKGAHDASAFLGILLVPVAAVVGSVGGVITADSAEEVNEREAALKAILADMKVQETLRDAFLKTAKEKTGFSFAAEDASGPATAEEQPDYRALGEKGVNTVQEVTVESFGLRGKGRVQPDLSLFMNVRVRLIKTNDNRVMAAHNVVYQGKDHKFAAWAANDAQLFKDEMDRCYQDLSERMVQDLYISNTLVKQIK